MSTEDLYGIDDEPHAQFRTDDDDEGRLVTEARQVGTLMQMAIASAHRDDTDGEDLTEAATDLASVIDEMFQHLGPTVGEARMTLWILMIEQWDDDVAAAEFDDLMGSDDPEADRSRFQQDMQEVVRGVASALVAAREDDDNTVDELVAAAADHADAVVDRILDDREPTSAKLVWACWKLSLAIAEQ